MKFTHWLRQYHPWRISARLRAVIVVLVFVLSVVVAPSVGYANSCQNLIDNGHMESENGWTTQSKGNYSLFSDYQVRGGSRAAYLAGVDNAEDRLIRSLVLPTNRKLTLTFWWLVTTEENNSGLDQLTLLLTNASGQPQRVLFTATDHSAVGSWQQFAVDLSDFAGESVQIQFVARTDSTLSTDFFVDDVELTACETSSMIRWLYLPSMHR
jgi:hypothetical protein